MKQIFCDNEGAVSSMRLLAFIVIVPVMVVWTVICIQQKQFIVPDGRIIALLGTVFGSKALQSFSENFSPPTPK